jgi:uncharacterized membrane protein
MAAQRGLLTCYILEVVALAVWTGGLVVIVTSVIPAVFNSLGMEVGGRFLTRVFDGYNRATLGAILILVASSVMREWAARVGRMSGGQLTRMEAFLLTTMIVIGALIMVVLGPQSVALQEEAFAAQEEGARKLAYAAFFRTHTAVRGLYLLNLALGIALLAVKVRAWTGLSGGKET